MSNRAAIVGNQGPKTGKEGQGSLPLLFPALLKLSAYLPVLSVEAHHPISIFGNILSQENCLTE